MVANTLDSGSAGGNQGLPNPAPSDPQNAQPPSTPASAQSPEQLDGLVAKKVLEALQNPDILKGMKDRRFNAIQQSLDSVSPVLEKVKTLLNPEQLEQFNKIQTENRLEQLEQMVVGSRDSSVNQPAGKQTDSALDVEPMLASLQFPANDAGLAALRIKHGNDKNALLKAAADLRISQLTSGGATPAMGLSMQNVQSNPSEQARIEIETQNYIKDMQGAAGKGSRFGDEIKENYRKKGVPVDNIHFKFS